MENVPLDGRIVECVYGMDTGSTYRILGEPYWNIEELEDYVKLRCIHGASLNEGEIIEVPLKEILYSVYYEIRDAKYGSKKYTKRKVPRKDIWSKKSRA